MLDFTEFYDHCAHSQLAPWIPHLQQRLAAFDPSSHGDFARWCKAYEELPDIAISQVDLAADAVLAGIEQDCDDATRAQLKQALMGLHPWRKGPFSIAGIELDTEWRSDWKWQRVQPHIQPLAQRKVLDIGCGSGYHLWRMRAEGAEMVIGVDPSLLFHVQFSAVARYLGAQPVYQLPLGIEDLPKEMKLFDTVFSMGILYHRRSPFDHLLELRDLLRPGGELVLETLVIEGEQGKVLVPDGRYGRMGNVWFIPSVATLIQWLEKVKFRDVRCVDLNQTSLQEQRATEWMRFQSLADFLDPQDPNKTIEGYPAPRRAVVLASAP